MLTQNTRIFSLSHLCLDILKNIDNYLKEKIYEINTIIELKLYENKIAIQFVLENSCLYGNYVYTDCKQSTMKAVLWLI